ncbi:MAG TPA: 50S ribosomal protein L11 methyltransferase [Phnomibacter sp.]|nr:50S ribosomal protein L11 methyltransferase [Phnomibacter sp.]
MALNDPYVQYIISVSADTDESAILIAQLSEWGMEGFEEQENTLIGGAKKGEIDELATDEFLKSRNVVFEKKEIINQNWNAIWESSFEPVLVNRFAAVRAHFHAPVPGIQHEIIITPKMSFGTGHHATTWLMIAAMDQMDFAGKKVLDFGTGTGVLAILADKLGATEVIGVDIDEWSIENAKENLEVNGTTHCSIFLADNIADYNGADILLANINRHILIEHMQSMKAVIQEQGTWLLSGLLDEDENLIIEKAAEVGMQWKQTNRRNGWISLIFVPYES